MRTHVADSMRLKYLSLGGLVPESVREHIFYTESSLSIYLISSYHTNTLIVKCMNIIYIKKMLAVEI